MLETSELRNLYSKIQKQLFYMIPEKWEKVYLYASVLDHYNNVQSGEMFFYYYPKSMLKKNPVNVYEVPNKFNIDEQAYLKLAENLYEEIKKLRTCMISRGEEAWSNLTIKIENFQFNVEYHYDDLVNSKYTSYDRHLIWRYKYLNIPLYSYQKKDRDMIEEYLSKEKFHKNKIKTYNEGVYKKDVSDIDQYNKQQVSETIQEENIRKEKTNEETKKDIQENITSQILKY